MAKNGPAKAKGKRLHGEGKSERDISGLCKVTRATAKRWIDEWEATGFPKGYLQPKLDQAAEKAALDAAEAAGLSKAKLYGKVATLLDAQNEDGSDNLDAIDKGLTHAERTVPGFKVADKVDITGGRSLLDEVLDEV